jgi:hypothetical protein
MVDRVMPRLVSQSGNEGAFMALFAATSLERRAEPVPDLIWTMNSSERPAAKVGPRARDRTITLSIRTVYRQSAKASFSAQENVKLI